MVFVFKILLINNDKKKIRHNQEVNLEVKKVKVSINDKIYEYQVEEKDLKILLKVIEAFSK